MRKHVSYTEARNDLSAILNQVCSENEPILIERRNGGNTVVISEEDWNAIQETLYLMRCPEDWKAITEKVNIEDCIDELPW